MLTFSFTVGNADEARTAADVCDFLAEQLTTPTRRKRASKTVDVVQVSDPVVLVADGMAPTLPPPANGFAPTVVPQVSDPAALYAALSGTAPVAVVEPPVVETLPAVEIREDRMLKVRDLIKQRGGKWFTDYIKAHNPANKKLSDHTDEELAKLHAAAESGVIPPAPALQEAAA